MRLCTKRYCFSVFSPHTTGRGQQKDKVNLPIPNQIGLPHHNGDRQPPESISGGSYLFERKGIIMSCQTINWIYTKQGGIKHHVSPYHQHLGPDYTPRYRARFIWIPLKSERPQPQPPLKNNRGNLVQWFVGIVLSVFIQQGLSQLITPEKPNHFNAPACPHIIDRAEYATPEPDVLHFPAKDAPLHAKQIMPSKNIPPHRDAARQKG